MKRISLGEIAKSRNRPKWCFTSDQLSKIAAWAVPNLSPQTMRGILKRGIVVKEEPKFFDISLVKVPPETLCVQESPLAKLRKKNKDKSKRKGKAK